MKLSEVFPIAVGNVVEKIIAGTNVTVDETNKKRPKINAQSSGLQSIQAGNNITVDNSNPLNPVINLNYTGVKTITSLNNNIEIWGDSENVQLVFVEPTNVTLSCGTPESQCPTVSDITNYLYNYGKKIDTLTLQISNNGSLFGLSHIPKLYNKLVLKSDAATYVEIRTNDRCDASIDFNWGTNAKVSGIFSGSLINFVDDGNSEVTLDNWKEGRIITNGGSFWIRGATNFDYNSSLKMQIHNSGGGIYIYDSTMGIIWKEQKTINVSGINSFNIDKFNGNEVINNPFYMPQGGIIHARQLNTSATPFTGITQPAAGLGVIYYYKQN